MSKTSHKNAPALCVENKKLPAKPTDEESPANPEPRSLPEIVVQDDKTIQIYVKSPENAKALFGAGSLEFADAMLHDCLGVSGSTNADLENGKKALAIAVELAPTDAVEALLTTQMAAVHIAMMRHSRLVAGAKTIQQLDIQERTFNKLARTFTAQTEALRKHRNGGQQKMIVEHVTVNDGGQAIVGPVIKGGG